MKFWKRNHTVLSINKKSENTQYIGNNSDFEFGAWPTSCDMTSLAWQKRSKRRRVPKWKLSCSFNANSCLDYRLTCSNEERERIESRDAYPIRIRICSRGNGRWELGFRCKYHFFTIREIKFLPPPRRNLFSISNTYSLMPSIMMIGLVL